MSATPDPGGDERLGGATVPAGDVGPPVPAGAPHGVPTAGELVEAVREFLAADVMTATEGRVRFHARVAVNVLATVERELALGPAQAVAHRRRLDSLGVADDAELALRIRTGALDDRWDEVVAVVRAGVADKLAVANPAYARGPVEEA